MAQYNESEFDQPTSSKIVEMEEPQEKIKVKRNYMNFITDNYMDVNLFSTKKSVVLRNAKLFLNSIQRLRAEIFITRTKGPFVLYCHSLSHHINNFTGRCRNNSPMGFQI